MTSIALPNTSAAIKRNRQSGREMLFRTAAGLLLHIQVRRPHRRLPSGRIVPC